MRNNEFQHMALEHQDVLVLDIVSSIQKMPASLIYCKFLNV